MIINYDYAIMKNKQVKVNRSHQRKLNSLYSVISYMKEEDDEQFKYK